MSSTNEPHCKASPQKVFSRYLFIVLLSVVALRAQTGNNYIIQNTGGTFASDVRQLESDSVQAYLTLHNLPSSDAALLYQYGRRDLRDELRALILSNLQNIIATPAAARTAHQQNLYNWFETLVYQNEVKEYQVTVSEHQKFEINPCAYRLDTTVANAYNLSYNYGPFCFNTLGSAFSAAQTPGPNYYLAVGLENSYNLALTSYPTAEVILGETQAYNYANIGYSVLPGAAAATATGVLYATSTIAPYAFRAVFIAGADSIPAVEDTLDIALASANAAAAPLAIVTMAAAIAIQAGMELQQQDADMQALAAQQSYYTSLVQNCNSIDLNTFLTDSSGVGQYKLLATFTAATLPDVPSTTPLPSRTEGVDPIWGVSTPNGPTFDSLQYTDWNGIEWTASLWGNYILQYQTLNPSVTSFATTIKVLQQLSQGATFSASRIGPNWLVTPQVPASNAVACPADSTTGLSAGTASLATCTSYVANSVPPHSFTGVIGTGVSGANNWSVITPPIFATNGTAAFVDGNPQTIVLSANVANSNYYGQTGQYQLHGVLPRGFSFRLTPSGITLSYSGVADPNLPGTYNLTVSAQFGSGGGSAPPYVTATTPLAITVKPGDAILTRSNTIDAFVGDSVSYDIGTAGHPNAVISLLGISLPPGLSFTTNGAAAATISGSPRGPGSASGKIETNYGAMQPLSISITYRQSPAFTSPNLWTFTDNVPGKFPVTLAPPSAPSPIPAIFASSAPFPSGFVASVAMLGNAQKPFTNQPWLHFQVNNNGSAILSGTPPSGTPTFVIYLASVLPNSLPTFQTLTLSSSDQPAVNGSDLLTSTAPVPVSCPPGTPAGAICGIVTVALPIVNLPATALTFESDLSLTVQADSLIVANSTVSGLFTVNSYLTVAGTTCPVPGASGPGTIANLRRPPTRITSLGSLSGGARLSLVSFHPPVTTVNPELVAFHSSNTSADSNLIPFHTFYIEIDAPPSITSQSTAYFSTGVSNSFSVTTAGFPEASTVAGSNSSATAMRVTLTGTLPHGVTFTDLTAAGLPTGTGTFSGTPTETGKFPVTLVANNGVGSPATQEFTLVVNQPGDLNADGVVNCTDIGIVKAAFGSYQGQASYDPRADVNHDHTVNILDLVFVTTHLPAGTRCQ